MIDGSNESNAAQDVTENYQIRLSCEHQMSFDGSDLVGGAVVFANDGKVAVVGIRNNSQIGVKVRDGDHVGDYLLAFESNRGETSQRYLSHNVLPIVLLDEDLERAKAGQLVLKVMYLDPATSAIQAQSSAQVDAGVDPVSVAEKKGTVVGVVRLLTGVNRYSAAVDEPTSTTDSLQVVLSKCFSR